jgi:hypothetical protein
MRTLSGRSPTGLTFRHGFAPAGAQNQAMRAETWMTASFEPRGLQLRTRENGLEHVLGILLLARTRRQTLNTIARGGGPRDERRLIPPVREPLDNSRSDNSRPHPFP